MAGDSKTERLADERFGLYQFDDFDPGGQPRFTSLESNLTLDEVLARVQPQMAVDMEPRLAEDAWRGGAFLTPDFLVIIAGEIPRV